MIYMPRITRIIDEINRTVVLGDDVTFDPKLRVTNIYYAGGTLCVDVMFWKLHRGLDEVKEIIFLNLDGSVSSTIHGKAELSLEDRLKLMAIYRKVKGPTKYYDERTQDVQQLTA